jgi:hypothetical protein
VWYSATNIQGAQQWHDEIGDALERCDWFIVMLSPQAVRSRWVKRELLFALNDARYEERIVPASLKTCDWKALSWTLGALQMVDLSPSFDEGCRRLLVLWGLGFDPRRAVQPPVQPPYGPRRALERRRRTPMPRP